MGNEAGRQKKAVVPFDAVVTQCHCNFGCCHLFHCWQQPSVASSSHRLRRCCRCDTAASCVMPSTKLTLQGSELLAQKRSIFDAIQKNFKLCCNHDGQSVL
jgi:hypothetical protein